MLYDVSHELWVFRMSIPQQHRVMFCLSPRIYEKSLFQPDITTSCGIALFMCVSSVHVVVGRAYLTVFLVYDMCFSPQCIVAI